MLGTFAGVFTPSILTILGIILFLRTGYVVGNGGLVGALLIIAIATAVSILTSISLAAIATNIDVKGGGDYYLISRTLGLEFGGAIGVVLFLAQSVSIAFYAIGFGEATSAIAGWESRLVVQVISGDRCHCRPRTVRVCLGWCRCGNQAPVRCHGGARCSTRFVLHRLDIGVRLPDAR